jgi:hypothetical protein
MDDDVQADLTAAAAVHAARRRIDSAIADLAASPFDPTAADRMRAILASPELRKARSALRRLSLQQQRLAQRPHLTVVTDSPPADEPAPEEPASALAGGAA